MAMDFFLAGDGAIGHREGCGGLERPLARFELERTREQKKPYLAKCTSWCRHRSCFLNYQHSKVAHVTQASFSSDAQLCSCHNCFSHYRQPPSLHQSVLIFERFAAANAKALIRISLPRPYVHGPPQLCRSTVAINATVLLRICQTINTYPHEV